MADDQSLDSSAPVSSQLTAAPDSISAQSPGEKDINDMSYAGATTSDVENYKSQTAGDMRSAGASDQDIKDYFGIKEPDMGPTKDFVNTNLQSFIQANKDRGADTDTNMPRSSNYAHTLIEHIEAGWQQSNLGMLVRQKLPDIQGNPDDGTIGRLTEMAIGAGADIPVYAAGGVAGSLTGAAIGQAALPMLPGAGAVGGAAVGAPTGAFAVEAGLRKMLIDHYMKGDIKDSSDFVDRLIGTTWEATKGAMTGAAVGLTGGLGEVPAIAARPILGGAAKIAAETAVFTGISKGLEGQMPHWQDFMDNALLIGGFHGVTEGATKLAQIYKNTGELPAQVAERAKNDPVVKQDLVGSNPDLPVQAVDHENAAPTEKIKVPEDHPLAQNILGDVKGDEPVKSATVPETYEPTAEDIEKDKAEERTPAEQRILEQMTDRPETKKNGFDFKKIPLMADNLFRDDLAEIKDKASPEAYDIAGNLRNKVPGVADRFIRSGTLDFKTGEVNGEGLHPILEQTPGGDINGLNAYMAAKRTLEIAKTGKPTAIDPKDARSVVLAGRDRFEATAKKVVDFQNRAMKYVKDSGALDPDSAKRMEKANKAMIPLKILQQEDPLTGKREGSGSPFTRVKGAESGSTILNPLQSVEEKILPMIRAAERNRLMLAIADSPGFKGEGEEPGFGKEESRGQKPVFVGAGELKKGLEEQGIDTTDMNLQDGISIFRPRDKNLADNQFEFMRDGREKIMSVTPEIAKSIKSLDPTDLNLFQKLARPFAQSIRAGTVLGTFILRHGSRNEIIAAMQAEYPHIPFVTGMMGVRDLVGDPEKFDAFLSSGAFQGAAASLKKTLDKKPWQLNAETGSPIGHMWNVIKSPMALVEALHHVNTIADAGPRIKAFEAAKGFENPSDPAAAAAARQVTIDNGRAGSAIRALNSVVPFMNVGIQGTARLGESVYNNPGKTLGVGAAAITLPSILTWLHGHNDSRYKEASDTEKALTWVIPTDHWEKAADMADFASRPDDLRRVNANGDYEVNNGWTFRIPKPFEAGVLMGSLPEMLLSKYADNNPDALNHLVRTLGHGLVPNILPPLVTAGIESATNYSFFTGNQIVQSHLEKELPELQQKPYTSTLAKILGGAIGATPLAGWGNKDAPISSPMMVDNWIRDLSGTNGQYLVRAVDGMLHAAGVDNDRVRPETTWQDSPFVREFTLRNPSMGASSVQNFYEKLDQTDKVMASISDLTKHGDIQGAMKIQQEHGEDLAKLNGFAQLIGIQTKAILAITLDKTITDPVQKRQLIENATYRAISTAQLGNKMMNDFRKSVNAMNSKQTPQPTAGGQ